MIFEQEAGVFSQIKDEKSQEYFVYFKTFHPQSWGKRFADLPEIIF